jgi:hypothetical protein
MNKLTEGKMRGQKKPTPKTRPVKGPSPPTPREDLLVKLEAELERLEDFEFEEGHMHIGPLWNAGYMEGLRDAVNCVRDVLNGRTRDE